MCATKCSKCICGFTAKLPSNTRAVRLTGTVKNASATSAVSSSIIKTTERPIMVCNFPAYIERNRELARMGFDSYKAYLRSNAWFYIRRRVMKRDDNQCRGCGAFSKMVYHPDTLQGRSLDGLSTICRSCHDHIERDHEGNKLSLREAGQKFRQLRWHISQRAVRADCVVLFSPTFDQYFGFQQSIEIPQVSIWLPPSHFSYALLRKTRLLQAVFR